MIITLVSDLNSRLHPQPSENELNEKDEVKMFRLLTTICDLGSGGKWSEALFFALVAPLCAFCCEDSGINNCASSVASNMEAVDLISPMKI